ncbi:beta-lactamase [Myxococcus stipitatus DSM 14675]|uniref:Beta-lactamase n=1 Tax=Myxococcus stipitatus (strain DSM 14675 / JCM 12634 / Mx s8) TaxID=1278073 RepID=L7UG55_MYXSD|nr:serine hydrolase [Myxococcus stipitatus]AGC46562.1 beta-lactamase [Myxococcus stipitatus DSM 14675]
MTSEVKDPTRLQRLLAESIQTYLSGQEEIGVSAALTVGDARALQASGLADREKQTPVREDTLFIIGSVQKVFTNTLAAARVIEGRMSLEEPVVRFLPSEVRKEGSVIRQVTPANLGTMTAAMPTANVPGQPAAALYRGEPPTPQLLDFWKKFNPERHIGTSYQYSNVSEVTQGFTMVGAAERSYPELFERDLQGPLELTDTLVDLKGIGPQRIAQGYTAEGKRIGFRGVGFNSTATDMLRFLEGNLFRVLSMPLLTYRAMCLAHEPRFQISPGHSIGMGWYVTEVGSGARLVSKAGGNGGFLAWAGFIPQRSAALVLLTNGHLSGSGHTSLPATGKALLLKAAGLDPAVLTGLEDADDGLQREEEGT